MPMHKFFFFLAELPYPFIELEDIITYKNLDNNEPGYIFNDEKKYKVKLYSLFKVVKRLKIDIEVSESGHLLVNFD